jgi:hypothetical protein
MEEVVVKAPALALPALKAMTGVSRTGTREDYNVFYHYILNEI